MKEFKPHMHPDRPREVTKTQEVLMILNGSLEVKFFDFDKKLIFEGVIKSGNVVVSYYGWHGFNVIEDDTVMLEVKVGSYMVSSWREDKILLEEDGCD